MSNKPKIYGFCDAGCKWETTHKSDFDELSRSIPRYEESEATEMEESVVYALDFADRYNAELNFEVTVGYYLSSDPSKKLSYILAGTIRIDVSEFAYGNVRVCYAGCDTSVVDGEVSVEVYFHVNGSKRVGRVSFTPSSTVATVSVDKCYIPFDRTVINSVFEAVNTNPLTPVYIKPYQVFIRYADDEFGRDMSEIYIGQMYMGIYTGEKASDDNDDYTWVKFVSDDAATRADFVEYHNGNSGLEATNVQDAIDEGILKIAGQYVNQLNPSMLADGFIDASTGARSTSPNEYWESVETYFALLPNKTYYISGANENSLGALYNVSKEYIIGLTGDLTPYVEKNVIGSRHFSLKNITNNIILFRCSFEKSYTAEKYVSSVDKYTEFGVYELTEKINELEKPITSERTSFIQNNIKFKINNLTGTSFDNINIDLEKGKEFTLKRKNVVLEGGGNYSISIYVRVDNQNIELNWVGEVGDVNIEEAKFTIPLNATQTWIYFYNATGAQMSIEELVIYEGNYEYVLDENIHVLEKDEKYKDYGLPVLYLDGDISTMSKDNAVELTYKYKDLSGTAEVKWQGTSSLNWEKKNYTVKFDQSFEAKEGWGSQKKYCMKANYIDFSHTRNVGSAKLWGQIVKTRTNAPTELTSLVNGGAVDGFPICIVINGQYKGIYTFNIPKDGWMMGMTDQTLKQAIICAEGGGGNLTNLDRIRFRTPPVVDGLDFDEEYRSEAWTKEEMVASLGVLQSILNIDYETDDAFINAVSPYLDINSVIDYIIFAQLIQHYDGINKNFLLVTFDGVKWFISAYDMDSTYGLQWEGKKFNKDNTANLCLYKYTTTNTSMIFGQVMVHCKQQIKDRYSYLTRQTVYVNNPLSYGNVLSTMLTFGGSIPKALLDKEVEIWKSIPSTSVNNAKQITEWYGITKLFWDEFFKGNLEV